jgi:lambda family phage portal protein
MGRLSGITINFPPKASVPEARRPVDVTAFDIGRTGRRLAAIPSAQTAINDLIRRYGNQAVARSRYLIQNNPYAGSAAKTFKSALVGTGIKPSKLGVTPAQKKAFAELWADCVPYMDADGVLDFYGIEGLIGDELFAAGEVFAVFDNPATLVEGMVPLGVRLYQSEMLPFWHNVPLAGGARIEMGIEFDADNRRVAYHFLTQTPGDFTKPPTITGSYTTRIPAERVMHIYEPTRVGQIRGIPYTLAGMVTLAMMDLYDDAELERKRTAALFAGFIKSEDPEDDGSESPLGALGSLVNRQDKQVNTVASLEPGVLIPLGPGEDITFSEPADLGGSYEAFQYRMLLRAAAGFNVPYSAMTGDLRSVNYSSIRAGLLEFRRRVTATQNFVVVQQFARPFINEWIRIASELGLAPWTFAAYRKNVLLYRRVKWLAPKWEWVDPLKDIQAEKVAVDNGFKARTDVIEEGGDDPEDTDDRIHADRKRAEDLAADLEGPLFGDPTGTNPPGEAPPEPPTPPGGDGNTPPNNGGQDG